MRWLWALALHDESAPKSKFTQALRMIEKAPPDDRRLVMKSADMALRAVGKRNPELRDAAIAVARTLADAEDKSSQWVGTQALRGLAKR